jgi:Protein of unknown function (DUF1203)
MSFRITGLPMAPFAALFELSDAELAERHAKRVIADRHPGYPCRVSLADAALGETVLLVNYEHLPVASPYRSRYAIYVRQNACEARLPINQIPAVLATRLLSVRSYDRAGMLIDADVVPGTALAGTIERLLSHRAGDFLHVHNAKPGCFAARVDRA